MVSKNTDNLRARPWWHPKEIIETPITIFAFIFDMFLELGIEGLQWVRRKLETLEGAN